MMLTESKETLVGLLKDANTYNYARDLQLLLAGAEPNAYLNTLELFAYGDYAHYVKYRAQYIALDEDLVLKLVKLTLLSAVNTSENTALSIERLLTGEEFRLGEALELIGAATEKLRDSLEEIIIDMVHDKLVDVKIDVKRDFLKVRRAYVLRDAYDNKKTSLLVLKEEDIASRSLQRSIAYISDWLKYSIIPARVDLKEESEHAVKVKSL